MQKTRTIVIPVSLLFLVCFIAAAQQEPAAPAKPVDRHRYKIDLKIDFDGLSYTGTQTVRWVNHGEKPTSVVYFHLYPNLRTGDQPAPANGTSSEPDEPRMEILEVRAASDNSPLLSSNDDQGATLRVNVREQVAPEDSTEILIKFKGTIPEIDRDETSLTT
ncbi:MAG TPA: hypothetical protein VGW58_14905, partial [Pyrinomonadaceae bacterium]|nr:hypothetical protein [Pyrinomonadaceae bacterium]